MVSLAAENNLKNMSWLLKLTKKKKTCAGYENLKKMTRMLKTCWEIKQGAES